MLIFVAPPFDIACTFIRLVKIPIFNDILSIKMGIQQPFLYDAVKSDSQSAFDPKAVTRASMTSRPPRPKQTGPLILFNQHPE